MVHLGQVNKQKRELQVDSSDEELDEETENIISARLYRLKAINRFPPAQSYVIATTLNNFAAETNWINKKSTSMARMNGQKDSKIS